MAARATIRPLRRLLGLQGHHRRGPRHVRIAGKAARAVKPGTAIKSRTAIEPGAPIQPATVEVAESAAIVQSPRPIEPAVALESACTTIEAARTIVEAAAAAIEAPPAAIKPSSSTIEPTPAPSAVPAHVATTTAVAATASVGEDNR